MDTNNMLIRAKEKLKEIRGARKGMASTVIQGVLLIVIIGVLLMIVVPVLAAINASMPAATGVLGVAQSAVTNNTGAALNISSIIPMVLAASTIIAALLVGLYAVFFKK
jgi:hypothetical protein